MYKMKYINHLNEAVKFGEDGIICSLNDIRDFAWGYNTQYSKITTFTKGISKKKIPFVVYGSTALANRIFEAFEKDVIAGKSGKLYIGDYYLQGYFYGVSKIQTKGDIVKGELEFVTDKSSWFKAVTQGFRPNSVSSEDGVGYPHGFPYDYASLVNSQTLNNSAYIASDFILTIYGQAINPVVNIGGHQYHVTTDLTAKQYLTINSYEKTIIKTDSRGTKTNLFAFRDLDNYIFKKIPTGENLITTSSEFNFDITLLQERSEPEWT